MTRTLLCVLFSLSTLLAAVPATAQHVTAGLLLATSDTSPVKAETVALPMNHAVAVPAQLRRALSGPFHPVRAAQFGIEGEVRVAYTVDVKGRARDVVVLEELGHGFDAEVYRVLRAARFDPARDAADQATASRYVTTFVFALDERR